MQAIDWAVLPINLVGISVLGMWTGMRVKNSSDLIVPRRLGKAMMATFAFGAGPSSDQAARVASKALSNGGSAIRQRWLCSPATPFYWVIAANPTIGGFLWIMR